MTKLPRRQPQRMCVACREMKDKRELVRVVRSPLGEIALDVTGKAPGRGAYLCADAACFMRAKKARCLDRAFKMKVSDDILDALAAEMERRLPADAAPADEVQQ